MNSIDKFQEIDHSNAQAVELLKALNHFEYPTEVCQIHNWIEKTKPLQDLIKTLCQNDKTRKTIFNCVQVVYDLIATNAESVSPAIWTVLELVEESKIASYVKVFAKDCYTRTKNALCAFLYATCQFGQRIQQLQTWCYAFISALEQAEKYWVLLSVSQTIMPKLFYSLLFAHNRVLVYHLIERTLYPITYPHTFNGVIHQIPEIMLVLESEENKDIKNIHRRFCGLVKALLDRFFSPSTNNEYYKQIRIILDQLPATTFELPLQYNLWDPKPKENLEISKILECPVCYERYVTPILVCENGHCICSNCKDHLKSCPLCRAKFSNIRMTVMDQIMEATEFKCKNYDSGCDVKMLYKEIWNHEIDCEFRTVSCDIVTFQSAPCLVCNEDVIVCYFDKHMEKYHASSVFKFEINVERKGELRRESINVVRLLKDSTNDLNFIERIFMTDEEIFFSYHYIGKNTDASNYVYTVKIKGKGQPQKIKYSNLCLPNYKGIYETEIDDRCLILEPEKVFNSDQTKVQYFVKIEDIDSYKLKLKKNKPLL